MRLKVGRTARRWLIALGVLVTVLVVVRLVLDPIASHFTRKALNSGDAIEGDFERVHVTIVPLGYEIRRLKIVEAKAVDWRHPLFYAERTRIWLDWRELLHARLAAGMRLDAPKLIVTERKAPPKEKTKAGTPDVSTALQRLTPARVNRIEVRSGELLFRDLTAPREPELWVHEIEAAAENLATRPALAHGRPATVSASATLGRSGALTLFVSADPFAKGLEFAGNLGLRGWKVAELYDLEQPATKLQTPQGTLSLFAEFKARNGAISGGVKPVLENVEVRPTEGGVGNRLKAWIADKGLRLFSDRVPGRNAVATVVPIEGHLDAPDVQLWPTVLGVVRNAFVEGISSGFGHLPPPVAEKKESPLTQAKHALDKDHGPPKAQPPKTGEAPKSGGAKK